MEPERELRWMRGGKRVRTEVEVVESDEQRVEEYSDWSSAEGPSPGAIMTTAATRPSGLYLGRYATVMVTEEAGASKVALDSQETVARVSQLGYTQAERRPTPDVG